MLITVAIVKRRYSIMHRRSRRSSFLFSHRFSNLTCTRTRVYTEAMAKTRKNSDKRGKTDIKKKKKYNNNVYSSAGSSRYPLRLRDSTWFSSQPVATPCPFALYRRTYDDNVSLNVRWRRIIERKGNNRKPREKWWNKKKKKKK